MQAQMLQEPMARGITPEQAAFYVQWSLAWMQTKSHVAAPLIAKQPTLQDHQQEAQFHAAQDAAFAAGAQRQQQAQQSSGSREEQFTTVGKDGKPIKNAPEPMDDEVTSDWELTDTEDETKAANEGRPPLKKKMKNTTKSEQRVLKEKRGARKQQQATGKVIQ